MFYINKRNKQEVVELIHSEAGTIIVVDQQETLKNGTPVGRIIRKGKKEFKKDYKKASTKFVQVDPINEHQKKEIVEQFTNDKIGILSYTEDYVESFKNHDRNEYFENMSEEDYKKSLEEMADPVVSKEPITHNDVMKAAQALENK